jgi:hypothetical protein
MNAAGICQRAMELVDGDRATTHGDKRQNHECIAAIWNGILEARRIAGRPPTLDAHDVANLMEGMKIARRYTGTFNEDDYVDGAGYAAVAYECGRPADG